MGVDRKNTTKTKNRFPHWEEHLIAQALAGEKVAFELLVEMHRPSILAHASRILRDSEDAQDAVQETFLKACRALKSFKSGRPMLPWLMRICSNCCVDIIRSRRNKSDCLDTYEHALCDERIDVARDLEDSAVSDTLRAAITRLPSRYREIIMMRHYRHMDVTEIAEMLGKPEGTIKSWLFRARALLKKELDGGLIAA
jgi:RNA polymerase sigma-70 factor (ECF subfamily)